MKDSGLGHRDIGKAAVTFGNAGRWPPLSGGTNPPPNFSTSVKVWGSPPSSTTDRRLPFLIVIVPGEKFQLGSGVPAAASESKLVNMVLAPNATFWQKPGPAAPGSLKVTGSHSSKATICAGLGVMTGPAAWVMPADHQACGQQS